MPTRTAASTQTPKPKKGSRPLRGLLILNLFILILHWNRNLDFMLILGLENALKESSTNAVYTVRKGRSCAKSRKSKCQCCGHRSNGFGWRSGPSVRRLTS
jgi:hypothetical protein